ncbi:hypothetical protein OSB04_022531 [Centaurea solstitialis]|uniref:Cytochrome P450 n=1 Tax=Centaurea solstitialis TaxID=347529 RepID=A0AA38SWK6_9ASTR|nr:hypothetical protein OSB04_022531 [Centaurea solstitialis]
MALFTISILILLAILGYKFTFSTTPNGAPPLPPGPRGLPIVGYLPFLSHDLHKQFTNMARTYGPIFKLQVGSKVHVVVNTLDLAKTVVRDQDESFANRKPSIATATITYGGQNIVWSNHNSYWRNLPIDINEISFATEANVLMSIIWENSSADGAKDGNLAGELQMIVAEIIELVSQPNVSDLFPYLARFDLQGVERKMMNKREQLDQIFTSIIDDRLKFNLKKFEDGVEHEGKKDFIQILLDLMEEKKETSLNITQIKALLVDIMVAGTETTTTLIEWAMAEIMQDVNVMKKVQEELVEIVGLDNIVEESHLPKLKYLDAVIKETFRLHPVVPLLIPRSPTQSCTVGGYTVPKGCIVFLNVWAIQRDPKNWDNPLEFNPERFLTNKWDYNGNNLNFFPFGAGRRLCPGIPLAEKMQMYVLASLLHSFDWSLPNGEEHDLSEKFGITLKKRKPLVAIPSQRLLNDMVVGGTDSSKAVEFALAEMMNQPKILKKAQQELKILVGKRQHSRRILHQQITLFIRNHERIFTVAPNASANGPTLLERIMCDQWKLVQLLAYPCYGLWVWDSVLCFQHGKARCTTLDFSEQQASKPPILCYKFTFSTTPNGAPPLPPGPRGLPIVGYLPFLSHDLHKQFTNMARTYGPIFKLQVGSKVHVVVNTLDLAKAVVRDHDESFANRRPSIAAATSTYGGQDIVWSNHNSYWRNLRKILIQEVLSSKSLEDCQSLRKHEVRKTVKKVYNKMGTTIDINEISFATEANVLTSIIWENTSAEGEKDGNLAGELQMIVSEIVELVSQPNVSDLFPYLARFDLQGVERKMKNKREQLDRIFTSIIDNRLKFNLKNFEDGVEHEGKKDFIQILLDLMEEKKETSLNITQIKALLVDIMVAGTETTTTLIEWAMAEIMQDFNVMKKVQEELVEIVGLDNIVEESHLPKLKYLDAVIKETFRLHPVVPFLIPRSPTQSCTVGGYTVPKGCIVFLNVWAIQRDPKNWDNPLKFNPKRFLANKWDYNGNNLNFFPFGAGRRLCPGVPLAEKMQMYVLASLLHSFDWSLPKGEEHDLSEKFGITLKKRKPLVAIPSQRLLSIDLYV